MINDNKTMHFFSVLWTLDSNAVLSNMAAAIAASSRIITIKTRMALDRAHNCAKAADVAKLLSPNSTYTICCGFAVQQAVDLS